jgi:glycosyltransferase involved in cell wall biosynthesis
MKKISIITPFFNESEGIKLYFSTLLPILHTLNYQWEIICVDDGSSDDTVMRIKEVILSSDNIKLIKLSRNFGKEAAVTAGLDYAGGNAMIILDADLQDPPDLIPSLIERWQQGYDVVLARRVLRSDGWWKDCSAKLYHALIFRLSDGLVPSNIGDYRIMDRKVVQAVSRLREKGRYLKGIFAWVGFKTDVIDYDRPNRAFGETKIGFKKLLGLALDGIVAFSNHPLEIWFYVGGVLAMMTLALAMFWMHDLLHAVVVMICGFAAMQMLVLGIMGHYISRVLQEVRNRPIYVIDTVFESRKSE